MNLVIEFVLNKLAKIVMTKNVKNFKFHLLPSEEIHANIDLVCSGILVV